MNEACVNQKCLNPCLGACGVNSECKVVNHNPICTCPLLFTGDPFIRCIPKRKILIFRWIHIPNLCHFVAAEEPPVINVCEPSPCGVNSQCREINNFPSCSCLPGFRGTPPNCRPECIGNNECANHLACIDTKCKDPCPSVCGQNAECRVVSHAPNCVCSLGYEGDPFSRCILKIKQPTIQESVNPCLPSPCGTNAVCKERNNAGSCTCLPEYIGNPYEGCRPECSLNSDCPMNKACLRNKCIDPCPGTCGQNANCQTINHVPSCSCLPNYQGNPFSICHPVQPSK